MIKRRQFIAGLGGAAVWPVVARAQQQGMAVVGYLHPSSPEPYASQVDAFKKGLSETGYFEGLNLALEFAWAHNEFDRLSALADGLVSRRVNVIVAIAGVAALAAKAATSSIPIVFNSSVSPVQIGLVASLNRPGGNLTGVTDMHVELGPKRLSLLHEIIPSAARFAALVNPNGPYAPILTDDERAAAAAIGRQIEIIYASNGREIDLAFANLAQRRVDALLITPDTLFQSRRMQLATLATRYSVPVMYQNREYIDAGGLISYGSSIRDRNRQIGVYAGRILKGENPSELPVMQPTKFELVINMKTAKALGLTIPETLLATADEVIQ